MTSGQSTLRSLILLIQESYSHRAWHGPNLRGSIRGISARRASKRPGRGRHNISEIVVHCAYWKYAVRRRLLREKRGSFPIKGSNWFRRPEEGSETAWKRDIALLQQCHENLMKAIRTIHPSSLNRKHHGSKISHETLLRGIASHDVYHAGQIQLIKRLLG